MALNPYYQQIGYDIIAAAFAVRKESGSFFKEKFYEAAIAYELALKGYDVKRQVPIKVIYKGVEINDAFVADIVVNDEVIIELKALSYFGKEVIRQITTYLKLSGIKLGFIINFGASDFCTGSLKNELSPFEKGIYRVVNGID